MILNNLAQNLSVYDNNILYSENPTNKIENFDTWFGVFKKNHAQIKVEELNSIQY